MNNNQYIPNRNTGIIPSQQQYDLNYNQIPNQQPIPMLPTQLNNFPLNQQTNLNTYNMYYSNNTQMQPLPKNPNGQPVIFNSQYNPLALYEQQQHFYQKSGLPTSSEQFQNQFNNSQLIQQKNCTVSTF